MKLTTILIISAAAALATPAFAQTDPNAPGVAGASSITPGETSTAAAPDNTAASNTNGQAASSTSNQMAMNNGSSATDNSSAASEVASIPDTEKKYKASTRAKDDQKEAAITKELNQQIASAK